MLVVYYLVVVLVTFIGHFLTPVLGYGAPPIVGVVLGLGLLHGAASGGEV